MGEEAPPPSAARLLREIGLAHLSKRPAQAKTFTEWKTDVREDYGSVNERNLYRVINWLVSRGLVAFRKLSFYTDGCERLYWRLADELPPDSRIKPHRCAFCGRHRLTYRTHIDENFHRWFRGRPPGRATHRISQSLRYETLTVKVVRKASRPPGRTSAEMSTRPMPGASLG